MHLFLLLVFTIPLLCLAGITFIPYFHTGIGYFLLFGILAASPSLAALMTVLIHSGQKGVRVFLNQRYGKRFPLFLALAAFLIPAVILFASHCLTVSASLTKLPITGTKLLVIAWALIAEELGWRGFLQPKLDTLLPAVWAPFVLGTIWAAWHIYFYFLGTMEVPFLLLLTGCIIESYGYCELTKKAKGNIIPASLWHISFNLFINLFLLNPSENNGSLIPYSVMTILFAAVIGSYFLFKACVTAAGH